MNLRFLNALVMILVTCFLSFTSPRLEALLCSAKAAGMGLVGAAYAQDALSGAFNPANTANVGDRFDVELSLDHFQGYATVSGSPVPGVNGRYNATRTNNFLSPDFGIAFQIGSTCYCDVPVETYLGLMVYNKDFLKTTYRDPLVLLGTSKAGLEFIRETIAPTIAVKIGEYNTFGLTLNCHVQRLKVNGLQNFDNSTFSAQPGTVTNKGYDYAGGVGVTLGWRSEITDWLSVGIAYSPKARINRFRHYAGFIAQHGRLDVPSNFLAGLVFSGIPYTNIAFDVQQVGYNHIRALRNSLNLFGAHLGDNNGTGFGWRGQTIYRVGADYLILDCLTVRAGYRYGEAPVTKSQTPVNVLTSETVQSYLTLGATWEFSECSEVTIYYAHGFNHRVRGTNAIPPNLRGGNVLLEENRDVVGIAFGQNF